MNREARIVLHGRIKALADTIRELDEVSYAGAARYCESTLGVGPEGFCEDAERAAIRDGEDYTADLVAIMAAAHDPAYTLLGA